MSSVIFRTGSILFLLICASFLAATSELQPPPAGPIVPDVGEKAGCEGNVERCDVLKKAAADCLTALDYMSKGSPFEAEAVLTATVEALELITPGHNQLYARSLFLLGDAYRQTGQLAKAEAALDRSLRIFDSEFPHNDFEIALVLNSLGANAYAQRKRTKAREALERAACLLRQCCAAQEAQLAKVLNNQAAVEEASANYDEAERMYTEAVCLYEQASGPNDINLATTLGNIAGLRWRRGDAAGAEAFYGKAKEVWERDIRPASPLRSSFYGNYGTFLTHERRYREAEDLHRQSIEILETCCAGHPIMAMRLKAHAYVLDKLHRKAEAKRLRARAEAIANRHPGQAGGDHTIDVEDLRSGH